MELLYSVRRKCWAKLDSFPESFLEGSSLCKISSRNVIAFTTVLEVDDTRGKTWGSHVYVCDVNVPWHTHKILSNEHKITALEWDIPGAKLVIADSNGTVQLWMFKDHILNEWVRISSTNFPGEHVLAAIWFHPGKKLNLSNEKKDSVLYSEKFSSSIFTPSLQQFGGRAAEGVLIISITGMIGTVIITKDVENPVKFLTESLGSIRQRITVADIHHGKNGCFVIAINNGIIGSSRPHGTPVKCYQVSLCRKIEKFSISSVTLPSFFLDDEGPRKNSCMNITHLKFISSSALVVAANSENGGLVEMWELCERVQPVSKLFPSKSLEPIRTMVWQNRAQYRCNSAINAVAVAKTTVFTLPCSGSVFLATYDKSIHCLSFDNLKEVASSSLCKAWNQDEPNHKYQKMDISIVDIDISWLNCILPIIDTRGNLYLYKILPEGPIISIQNACTLLEYCMITGLDWVDVLFCLSSRSNIMEPLCERLDTSYNRQPVLIQQYYYAQFLCIKISLYRMSTTGQTKATDLTSLLMINAIASAFKSLLRPSELISQDKGPAENLNVVINDSIADVDKILLHLDPKEFTVEPSTLQSLQQLIQWVADLALNLLVRLPDYRAQNKSSGYELLKDHKALNKIRELLVIIRIWGLLRSSCLPFFLRNDDNLDVLALLFRLLSKLVPHNGESQQIDDGLIDECCLLSNQVRIPQLHQSNCITGVASPILSYKPFPLELEYLKEPEEWFIPESNLLENRLQSTQTVDIIRHLFLGSEPLYIKQCTRCGGKAQVNNSTRTAAIRAWDQRWACSCRCGGLWRIHKNSF